MEEAPENGKELSNSAHANGMNECKDLFSLFFPLPYQGDFGRN